VGKARLVCPGAQKRKAKWFTLGWSATHGNNHENRCRIEEGCHCRA
jgi:hypothetical protein